MRRAVRSAVGLAMVPMLIQACAGGAMPSAPSTSSAQGAAPSAPGYGIYGTDRYFSLQWQADQRGGKPTVSGYVTNQWGMAMRNVRLRVEALDAAGNATASYIGYVNGYVTPGSRVYWEVPVQATAASYRVSVLSYDVIQGFG